MAYLTPELGSSLTPEAVKSTMYQSATTSLAAQYVRAASVPWYQNYVAMHPDEIAKADAYIAQTRARGGTVGTIIQPVEPGKTYTYNLNDWIRTGAPIVPTVDESSGGYQDSVKISSSVSASMGSGQSTKEMSSPSPNNIANPILKPISTDDLDVKAVNFKFPDVFELAKKNPVATLAIVAGVLWVVL